mmetsp:Transcript_32685/g.59245  ORF Transcript_32685/g.59245 Transcript_32685/m.59245 type:complete len:161 (+) Transcript_32685:655-1137(+)
MESIDESLSVSSALRSDSDPDSSVESKFENERGEDWDRRLVDFKETSRSSHICRNRNRTSNSVMSFAFEVSFTFSSSNSNPVFAAGFLRSSLASATEEEWTDEGEERDASLEVEGELEASVPKSPRRLLFFFVLPVEEGESVVVVALWEGAFLELDRRRR